MSLKHGILGLLSYSPMSGYDLTKVFNQSLNFFWTASMSQIYRELETMSASGWIEVQEERQRGHRVTTIYAINDSGRAELDAWLSAPLPERITERSAIHMRFFFQARVGPECIKASLLSYKEAVEDLADYLREELKTIKPRLKAYDGSELAEFCWDETAAFGLEYYEMQARWAERCIARLEGRALPPLPGKEGGGGTDGGSGRGA